MTTTNNLGITLIEQAQAQKEVTINQALTLLDSLIGGAVADKDLATPPASPTTGVAYIVAASPTGAWAGKATAIAYFDQIWRFITPQTGMRIWVRDESLHYQFNGAAWVVGSLGATLATGDAFVVTPAATAIPASTEASAVYLNLAQTRQHATGALALQRDVRISGATHSAVAASTITNAAAFAVDGACIAGANATITNSSAIYSAGSAVTSAVTNSYGLNITANTGATNNYVARFAGTAGEVMNLRSDGKMALLSTNTASGTTGARTINQPSGTVNFAAAATSLVVTNALCTTASLVFAAIRTNDSTAVIKNIVPGAGSFTITLSAAATAETSVGFFIIN